ncbi:MAG: glycosyltransferase [bacterium]|nr:glycosyltransferase [bacterium]
MQEAPQVTVLMPVYNAQDYLIDAMASIVEQSFQDWEMICVNDGSRDQSGEMLDWFAAQDQRIRVVHQANQGLVGALNVGIELSRGHCIMRMDNDDIAMTNRMQKQLNYMNSHPECVVLGGAILEIDSDSDPLGVSQLPHEHDLILNELLHRRTGHFHPTTMIRTAALRKAGGYRRQYEWVEDHDLWLRMSEHGRLANLSDVLLCYRQHASSICWQRSAQQRELMNRLLSEAYQRREQDIPADVLLSETTHRSAAGPGKWARAAARGGYTSTAWKHLRRLNRSDAKFSYKMRMTVETLGRMLKHSTGSRMRTHAEPQIPQLEAWQRRWMESGRVARAA